MFQSLGKCDKPSTRSKWGQNLLIFFMLTWSFVYFLCVFHLNRAIKYDVVENTRFEQRITKKCMQRTKISFLMTHGTQSEVVRSILLRYGYSKDLNFVFGKEDSIGELRPLNVPFTLDYFKNMSKSEFPWHQILLEREGYDISTLYMKWNKSAVSHLLGPDEWFFTGDDAYYISLLKKPTTKHSNSSLLYANTTLGKPNGNERAKETLLKNKVHADIKFRYNQQILDMGMPEDDIKNSFKIHEHIKELQNEFDFVMIEEMFYESLVLLADKLCLPLEYMIGFETNAIKKRGLSTINELKTKDLDSKFVEADERLYNVFYDKFQELIKKYGNKKMSKAINKLKSINKKAKQTCKNYSIGKQLLSNARNKTELSNYDARTSVDKCKLLNMKGNELIHFVYKEQKKKFLLKQQKRILSKFGSQIELDFERKFLWG